MHQGSDPEVSTDGKKISGTNGPIVRYFCTPDEMYPLNVYGLNYL